MTGNIAIPTAKIAAFCRRHHIRRLSLFGSVLRDDVTPESEAISLEASCAQRCRAGFRGAKGPAPLRLRALRP